MSGDAESSGNGAMPVAELEKLADDADLDADFDLTELGFPAGFWDQEAAMQILGNAKELRQIRVNIVANRAASNDARVKDLVQMEKAVNAALNQAKRQWPKAFAIARELAELEERQSRKERSEALSSNGR